MFYTLAKPLARTAGYTDDFVEDSEPEREEYRRKKAQPIVLQERNARISASTNQVNTNVIEISDDSDNSDSERIIPTISNPATCSMPCDTPTLSNEGWRSGSPKEKNLKGLDLDRFAYNNPMLARKGRTHASSPITYRKPSQTKQIHQSTTLEISALNLDNISRCICCDLPWTARKTNIQKLAHIRSCAKKQSLNEDTVKILLQKEIAKVNPSAPSGKGKEEQPGCLTVDTSSKKTFMEDILVQVGPRKRAKAKAKDIRTLVAGVSGNRDNILSRARLVLSSTSSSLNTVPLVPATGLDPNSLETDENCCSPSSTQPFSRSSLGQLQGVTTKSLFATTSPPPSPSSSAHLHSIHVTSLPMSSVGVDGNLNHGGISEHLSVVADQYDTSFSETSKISLSSSKSPKKVSRKLSKVLETPIKTVRRKRTAKQPAFCFDEDWEAQITKQLLQNKEIHMRILRYEPLDFNTFLGLAQQCTPVNRKLTLHLREYLDKKAIHFYEATRSKGRGRRK